MLGMRSMADPLNVLLCWESCCARRGARRSVRGRDYCHEHPDHTERAAGPLSPAVRAARGDGAARHGGSCALACGRPQCITGKGERRRGDGQDHRRRPSPPGAPRCRPWLPRWARCASSAFRVAGVWGHRAQPTAPDRDSHRQAARRWGGHRRRGSRARGCSLDFSAQACSAIPGARPNEPCRRPKLR